MHLHTVVVSYHRPALTKLTVESYLSTVSVPHSLIIVDNGSTQQELETLAELNCPVIKLGKNMYPGFATNLGWSCMPGETTLLQRIDNDTKYLPNWCDEMLEAFKDPDVGQYGPIANGDQEWTVMDCWPCGGNSVIKRELYDKGLRYTEIPWPELTVIEEHQLTLDVLEMGYKRVFGTKPGIEYLDDGDTAYHIKSFKDRGLSYGSNT